MCLVSLLRTGLISSPVPKIEIDKAPARRRTHLSELKMDVFFVSAPFHSASRFSPFLVVGRS